ncbi:MAG: Rieske 2Fe-2S domain-containing protein [Pirellulales bacterium]|nr:Rieske 2Fe-2S domain-containing protein [Pirellulales bacterium]
MGDNTSTKPAGAERRSFLVRLGAAVCGGLAAVFPFAAGWGVATNPWRRGKANGPNAGGVAGGQGAVGPRFVRICPLSALEAGGAPRAFPVIADSADAWTRMPNQRIGMIFLQRTDKGGGKEKPQVVAFHAVCPHLGCFVEFNHDQQRFECPCHKSAFHADGTKDFGPSLRGLDSLVVKIEGAGVEAAVSVAFQNFQAGIAERKPVG